MYRAFRRYLTQQRVSSFLVIFALILASCDSEDVVTDPDWCYTFNYLTNDYETNFTAGSWLSGTGFIPNGSNDLSFSYSNGQTVNAAQVVITVARPEGVTGDITGLGNGIIFGITPPISPFPLSLAAELESAELPITAEGLSDSGTTMNISVSTDKPFALESIHVRGWGVNPFPFNECPKGTPTATASPTNIATSAPTSTDIATETGTPAPTPTYGDQCLQPGQPTPTPSSPTSTPGPSPTPTYNSFTDTFDSIPTGISSRNIPNSWSGSQGIDGTLGNPAPSNKSTAWFNAGGTNIVVNWIEYTFDAPVYVRRVQYLYYPYGHAGGSSRAYARKVLVGGSLSNIAGGGEIYPTEYAWSGVNYTFAPVLIDAGEKLLVQFEMRRGATWSYSGVDNVLVEWTYVTPPATPTPTTIPNCTPTPTATPTGTIPPTLTPSATPSRTPVTLTPTISPTPSRTLAPVIVPSQTPPPATSPPTLVYPSLTPNPGVTNTPVPNTPAPGTPSWTGTPNMTATSLALGTPFPGSGVNPGDGGGLVGDIGGLGTGMIGAGSNIMSRATGWMNSVTGTFTSIVNGYFYAIPQAPPSVPRCATAPLESELCAIYFFLTHTVLSGTVGSVIIPLATIVVTLVVLFAFIRLARAILGRAMEATKS